MPLPDHAGESPLLSRSGGEKGLRGSGAGTLGEQRVRVFSLAESLPGKKRSLSSSYWALLLLQGVTVSPLVSQLDLSEVSLNFFDCENGNMFLQC